MRKQLNSLSFKMIFLITLIIFLFLTFFDYNFRNERTIEGNLKAITEESNQQLNVAISNKLIDEIHILQAFASLLSLQDDIISDAAFTHLQDLLEYEMFTRIAVSLPNGISYTSDHYQHDTKDREYFKESMKGNIYISNKIASVLDHQEVIVMSVPIFREKQVIGVLRATINIDLLHEYFALSIFSGEVSSYIMQTDGLTLTLNEEEEEEEPNFFTVLENNENPASIIEKMKNDFSDGNEGSVEFTLDGKNRFAYYSPIEHSNWFVLTTLPYALVETQLHTDLRRTLQLAIKIFVALTIGGIYIFYLQKEGSRNIKNINKRLDAIIANTPGTGFCHEVTKPDEITFFNHGQRTYAGYTREEIITLIQTDIEALIFPEDLANLQNNLLQQSDANAINTYRILDKQKKIHWIYDQRHVIWENGKQMYYVVVLDITEMRTTQEQLKISEERYQLVLQETQSVIFEWNVFEDCITLSDLWTKTYGYPKQIKNFLTLTHKHFAQRENSYIPLIESLSRGQERDQIDCLLPKANGEEVWIRIIAKAIQDKQGYLIQIIGSISDISQEKQKTMKLMERAQRDGLTNIFNRVTTEAMINQILQEHPQDNHVLMVIDIDDFKSINDTLGHTSGDEALTKISKALQSCLRRDDIIGRIGGDEFVVFLKHVKVLQASSIAQKSEMLLQALATIQLSQNPQYRIKCSIGIATHPQDGNSYHELFKNADKHLYIAKKQGKNTYVFDFDEHTSQ